MLNIARRILIEELHKKPIEISRFTNGYCHHVYYVKAEYGEYVLRITNQENQYFYNGSVKWLKELGKFDLPIPKLLKYGQFHDVFYTLISYIPGKDIGDVYRMLDDVQKRNIAKKMVEVQKKVSKLPSPGFYGLSHPDGVTTHPTWMDYIQSLIEESRICIKRNQIFHTDVCNEVLECMKDFKEYFSCISPKAFLDDISTKNVLVYHGQLSGIVDVDEICYGDSFLVIGLTNMALLKMGVDTHYIDYWMEEANPDNIQRKATTFYTLLNCIIFMGEQGTRFDNGNTVAVNPDVINRLNEIYHNLLKNL